MVNGQRTRKGRKTSAVRKTEPCLLMPDRRGNPTSPAPSPHTSACPESCRCGRAAPPRIPACARRRTCPPVGSAGARLQPGNQPIGHQPPSTAIAALKRPVRSMAPSPVALVSALARSQTANPVNSAATSRTHIRIPICLFMGSSFLRRLSEIGYKNAPPLSQEAHFIKLCELIPRLLQTRLGKTGSLLSFRQ